MGTHFSFLFSIYSENYGVQAEPLNFTRSSDITYVAKFNEDVEEALWSDYTAKVTMTSLCSESV